MDGGLAFQVTYPILLPGTSNAFVRLLLPFALALLSVSRQVVPNTPFLRTQVLHATPPSCDLSIYDQSSFSFPSRAARSLLFSTVCYVVWF
ncbi:hypothetical protein B0H11DRAFT_174589 [Mycena galericulata]|nr:hypothetical protein B0H11DRAFT_174589 [Mycena galericulata]